MKKINQKLICELNILKNRLESGESIIQCLASMGVPLQGPKKFLSEWDRLSTLMIEGRVLPAKAVREFVCRLEDENRLINLVGQKTLSPRIQSWLSIGVIFLLLFSSAFFFPESLRPSLLVLSLALGLSALSAYCMQKILQRFLKQLIFLECISFLRSLSLSMQCGMTLTTALSENLPEATALQRWPLHFRKKLSLDYLESDNSSAPASSPQQRDLKLWELAERVWDTLRRNYKEGLPQVEMLAKLTSLMEEEFKNWMNNSSEKLSYLLLIPLFTLSVPAVLILLFAPLLSALGN